MGEDKKRVFPFKVEYYRPSGKFYADGEFVLKVTDVANFGDGPSVPYMPEAVELLRQMGTPPGLNGDGWDGPVRLTSDYGYPVLIMGGIPKSKSKSKGLDIPSSLNSGRR